MSTQFQRDTEQVFGKYQNILNKLIYLLKQMIEEAKMENRRNREKDIRVQEEQEIMKKNSNLKEPEKKTVEPQKEDHTKEFDIQDDKLKEISQRLDILESKIDRILHAIEDRNLNNEDMAPNFYEDCGGWIDEMNTFNNEIMEICQNQFNNKGFSPEEIENRRGEMSEKLNQRETKKNLKSLKKDLNVLNNSKQNDYEAMNDELLNYEKETYLEEIKLNHSGMEKENSVQGKTKKNEEMER